MKNKPIYTLDLSVKNANVLGTINGFPVFNIKTEFGVNFAPPLNPYLTGEKNLINITVSPIVKNLAFGDDIINADFSVDGKVKVYEDGEISGPEYGEGIIDINISNFGNYSYIFDNEKISFKNIFKSDNKIEDKDLLYKYALKLCELIEQKNIDLLYEEFKFKIKDFAISFYDSENEYHDEFIKFMTTKFLPLEPDTSFNKELVGLRNWCDKRIWEIYVLPDKELFVTKKINPEKMEFAIPIYVALINGKIKVIR